MPRKRIITLSCYPSAWEGVQHKSAAGHNADMPLGIVGSQEDSITRLGVLHPLPGRTREAQIVLIAVVSYGTIAKPALYLKQQANAIESIRPAAIGQEWLAEQIAPHAIRKRVHACEASATPLVPMPGKAP